MGTRVSKYKAIPVVVDGVRFASKAEAARDAELQLLERTGKTRNIKRQPKFPVVVNGVKVCTYIADWQYDEVLGENPGILYRVVEDKKGVLTPVFRLKWKLVKALHPEVDEWRLS